MSTGAKKICFLDKKFEEINLAWQSEPKTNPYSDDDGSAIPLYPLVVYPVNVMYVTRTVQQVTYCSMHEL